MLRLSDRGSRDRSLTPLAAMILTAVLFVCCPLAQAASTSVISTTVEGSGAAVDSVSGWQEASAPESGRIQALAIEAQAQVDERQAQEALDRARELRTSFYTHWLMQADLTAADIPSLRSPPAAAAAGRLRALERLNGLLSYLRTLRTGMEAGIAIDLGAVEQLVGPPGPDHPDLWRLYRATRAKVGASPGR